LRSPAVSRGNPGRALRRRPSGEDRVEVDTLEQLDEALEIGVDAVLLDNMGPETLAEAVRRIAGRAIARLRPHHAGHRAAIAAAGVDLISAGWLTHSASVLDIGLDWRSASASAGS